MQWIVYGYDIPCVEHSVRSVSSVVDVSVCDEIEQLKTYSHAYMILTLDDTLRENEALVRALVAQENTLLLLQRVPLLASAHYYLKLGVKGYGNALMHSVYFRAAMETLQQQMIWLHPQLIAQLVGEISPTHEREFFSLLTQREQEIATYLLEGKTNYEIANFLSITPRTVKSHVSHLYQKLHVKDRLDFALRYK